MSRTLAASFAAFACAALVLLGRPAFAAEDPETQDGGAAPVDAARAAVLAAYDFEDPVASGPDTFWARHADGGVIDLTTAFRFSGERSLRLREAAGNGDFVEFLAYFAERTTGAVFVQFYVLFADPGERFNFGLAGERWFLARERGGHAVWLQTSEDRLLQHTASASQSLATVRTFTWYFVDLVYHVDSGSYDVALWQEGVDDALVDLRGVRAYHDHDASPVKFASFIGDLEDQGHFDVFIDDLLIASDPSVRLGPFVAPGRRSLFVDRLPSPAPPPDAPRQDLIEAGWRLLREHPDGQVPPELEIVAEQAADEALRGGELSLAEVLYERLRQGPWTPLAQRAMLKLADVHHLLGHVDEERELREAIYGRVELEELASAP